MLRKRLSYRPSGEVRATTRMMLVDFFLVVIPCRWTSCGSLGWAIATRFWTSTCAMSRLVPTSKVTVRLYEPSLAQVEDM